MMRTAPEGRWFIVGAWIIALILVIGALRAGTVGWWIAAPAWVALSIWVVAFFRDPNREGARGHQYVVAPADGKVVSIVEVEEPTFFNGRAVRISIFMNVFDVHVNRYPTDGTVAYRHYNAGKFGHAGAEKSSLDNEQSSVGLDTSKGKVLIRQIAGLIARRIVTDHSVGEQVRQGERMGMIRFGSRVDLFVPVGARVLVRVGDRTRAGVTVVAQWN
ncbi:MAG: phosphatidylserine decarboxylase family protein [Gemmatimonadales bacterium]